MDSPAQPPPPSDEEALLAEHAALDREEESLGLRPTVPAWLRDNPGLCLTLIYLFSSVVGMVFHFLFLKRFGFNVLEFSETSDFLMVVVREPLTVALAMMGAVVFLAYGWTVRRVAPWLRRRARWLRSTPEKRRATMNTMRRWAPLLQVAFIATYAFLFMTLFSKWRASRIRGGDFRQVTVHYRTDAPKADGSLSADGLALLGTTSRFIFLYDSATKRSEVVPLDSIARLTWDARTRKEREADVKE